jgi:hypothetical protein
MAISATSAVCSSLSFFNGVNTLCVSDGLRVWLRDVVDFKYSNSTTNVVTLYPPDPTPSFLKVQDPASEAFFDKLVGIALDGIPIYSGLSANGCDVFSEICGNNTYSLDKCGGSYGATSDGWRYHYRVAPTCLQESVVVASALRKIAVGDVAELWEDFYSGLNDPMPMLVGYTLTGHDIYSPFASDGSVHESLDNCNGKMVNGSYTYFSTLSFPYVVGCDGPGVYVTGNRRSDGPQQVVTGQCPSGMYNDRTLGCRPCPAGRYSYIKYVFVLAYNRLSCSVFLLSSNECSERDKFTECPGLCPAGHYCSAGSVHPIPCPGGRFGAATGILYGLTGTGIMNNAMCRFNVPIM